MIVAAVLVLCMLGGSLCAPTNEEHVTKKDVRRMKIGAMVKRSTSCSDQWDDCAAFKQEGWCPDLKDECKNTCGYCGKGGHTTQAPPKPTCVDDSYYNCSDIKKYGICDYFKKECKKTCGFCGKQSTPAPPKPTTQRPKPPTRPPTTARPPPPPVPGSCGKSNVQQSRIIAGVDAQRGAWPWIASLVIQNAQGGLFHFCGGSLIHPQWVLTAAHCVESFNASLPSSFANFKIGLGVHNRSDSDPKKKYLGVEAIYIHHSWPVRTDDNWQDIALVKLKTPALLTNRIKTVCLPRKSQKPAIGSRCYLAGWGTTKHPGDSPAVLQQAMMPVVSPNHCFQAHHMICTGYGNSSKINACRGDSGGPLMCQNADSSWTVHGIASFVVEYCKYYTAFADVGIYLDWIRKFAPV